MNLGRITFYYGGQSLGAGFSHITHPVVWNSGSPTPPSTVDIASTVQSADRKIGIKEWRGYSFVSSAKVLPPGVSFRPAFGIQHIGDRVRLCPEQYSAPSPSPQLRLHRAVVLEDAMRALTNRRSVASSNSSIAQRDRNLPAALNQGAEEWKDMGCDTGAVSPVTGMPLPLLLSAWRWWCTWRSGRTRVYNSLCGELVTLDPSSIALGTLVPGVSLNVGDQVTITGLRRPFAADEEGDPAEAAQQWAANAGVAVNQKKDTITGVVLGCRPAELWLWPKGAKAAWFVRTNRPNGQARDMTVVVTQGAPQPQAEEHTTHIHARCKTVEGKAETDGQVW
jgi:hypothetical protein